MSYENTKTGVYSANPDHVILSSSDFELEQLSGSRLKRIIINHFYQDIGAHAMLITNTNSDGYIVSSWAKKFIYRLQNNPSADLYFFTIRYED